jgi:hypothetical protein
MVDNHSESEDAMGRGQLEKQVDSNENRKESLFNQVKDIEIIGQRLSGEPEIVHESEDFFRRRLYPPIIRRQIKKILEYVPSVFPEGWKSPESYNQLTESEKKAYENIARNGIFQIPGPMIQEVIELAIKYREAYKK